MPVGTFLDGGGRVPHVSGIVTAGIPEATRAAHALIHRGAEAGIVVVAGERADRIHAERLPEAGPGERLSARERRERRRRDGGEPRPAGRRRRGAPPDDAEGPAGRLVDLQA
jgi:hypothetical protein